MIFTRILRRPSLVTTVAVALAGLTAAQTTVWPPSEIEPQPCEADYVPPAIVDLGPADMSVQPTGYTIGGVFTAAGNYPLVEAIEAAESVYQTKGSTVVIDVQGVIPAPIGMQFGGGDAGQKAYRGEWANDPIDVALRGETGPGVDRIGAFSIQKNLNDGTTTPGVRKLRLRNLSITANSGSNSIISTPLGLPVSAHGKYPRLQVYGCTFERGPGNPKWGARLQGRSRFSFRNCHFEYLVEHCVYADSPQGDSDFRGNSTEGSTRTMLQIVNRAIDNPGPSGFGRLYIGFNVATNIDGDGGGDYTVAGHPDLIVFDRNLSLTDPGQAGSQGSIVVWSDASKGLHLNANGFANGKVIVKNHGIIHPNADRSHIQIAGAEKVEVRGNFLVQGNRTCFDFDNSFGGPIATGQVCFDQPAPLSGYAGFQAGAKIKVADVALTDPQIDALSTCPDC